MYGKPTHTDRYLDFHSRHDNNHKISTAATLIHRAINVPNSQTGRDQEINRVYTALDSINGYPTNLITQITKKKCLPTPEEQCRDVFQMCWPATYTRVRDPSVHQKPHRTANEVAQKTGHTSHQ